MLVDALAMNRYRLTVEEVDALTGPAMGRPKTATLRMLDIIGLDTLLHVVDNVRERSMDAAEQPAFCKADGLWQLVDPKGGSERNRRGILSENKTRGQGQRDRNAEAER